MVQWQILSSSGSLFQFANKQENAWILSAILLFCIFLKIKECGIRSVVGHIIVVVTGIRGKTSKILFFTTTQMKRKKVFWKPLFFFWEGRCNGEWCPRYWIREKEQQYHSSLLKRTKTLSRFIEVDFITKNDELVICIYASLFFV